MTSIRRRLTAVLKTGVFSAVVLYAGCSVLRNDPMLQNPAGSPFVPAFTSASTPSKPKALQVSGPTLETIQGPEMASSTQALTRTSSVVLDGKPTPPSPEIINLMGDRLITALESNQPVPPTLIAGEAASQDPWSLEKDSSQPSATSPLPEIKETGSVTPSGATGVTEFPANRDWTEKQATEELKRLEGAVQNESSTTVPAQGQETPVISETPPTEAEGSYRLGPGDSIDVTVWEMPELSRALVVRPDGYISYPLIHEIKVTGKTPSQLEHEIQEALSEHLIEPEVNVVVTSVGSKSVFIFGAVANPGVYPHFRQTTLLQGIITAGGFPSVSRSGQPVQHGDLSRIRIIRTHDTGREIITKNLKGLRDKEVVNEDIPLQPDDIVYVPQEANLVYVFGEVMAPGVIPISDGTRILEALLTAGGVRPSAKRDQILVIRPATGVPTYACVSLKEIERGMLNSNLELQNGDIIYVPQKFIAKVAEFVQLYSSAIQPALETYLTSWDAWFVHERFSALRSNNWGMDTVDTGTAVNPDP